MRNFLDLISIVLIFTVLIIYPIWGFSHHMLMGTDENAASSLKAFSIAFISVTFGVVWVAGRLELHKRGKWLNVQNILTTAALLITSVSVVIVIAGEIMDLLQRW